VERGVPLVTVFWPNDGIKNASVYWDTHSRNFIDLKQRLMPVADQAFTALLDDLESRGMLDETLVIWTGRVWPDAEDRPRWTADAGAGRDGRDHWRGCFTTGDGGRRCAWRHDLRKVGSARRLSEFRYPVLPMGVRRDRLPLCSACLKTKRYPDVSGRPHFVRPGE
jgi:hypothetical protein